jgi:hypothetical protein
MKVPGAQWKKIVDELASHVQVAVHGLNSTALLAAQKRCLFLARALEDNPACRACVTDLLTALSLYSQSSQAQRAGMQGRVKLLVARLKYPRMI